MELKRAKFEKVRVNKKAVFIAKCYKNSLFIVFL